uniref:Polyprotein n=1 Tax=Cryphonectria hypovirus 1 TaxID=40281 RepID=E2GDD0_9VIRU|nr:polyprotein [Cryphonectria hypovirus 1]
MSPSPVRCEDQLLPQQCGQLWNDPVSDVGDTVAAPEGRKTLAEYRDECGAVPGPLSHGDLVRLHAPPGVCRCQVHFELPTVLKNAADGTVPEHPAVLDAYLGRPRRCSIEQKTRELDALFLHKVYSTSPRTPSYLLARPPRSVRGLCTARSGDLAQFGQGYCYLNALDEQSRWRVARTTGWFVRVDDYLNLLRWVGRRSFGSFGIQEVAAHTYHVAINPLEATEHDGEDLFAAMRDLAGRDPSARIGGILAADAPEFYPRDVLLVAPTDRKVTKSTGSTKGAKPRQTIVSVGKVGMAVRSIQDALVATELRNINFGRRDTESECRCLWARYEVNDYFRRHKAELLKFDARLRSRMAKKPASVRTRPSDAKIQCIGWHDRHLLPQRLAGLSKQERSLVWSRFAASNLRRRAVARVTIPSADPVIHSWRDSASLEAKKIAEARRRQEIRAATYAERAKSRGQTNVVASISEAIKTTLIRNQTRYVLDGLHVAASAIVATRLRSWNQEEIRAGREFRKSTTSWIWRHSPSSIQDALNLTSVRDKLDPGRAFGYVQAAVAQGMSDFRRAKRALAMVAKPVTRHVRDPFDHGFIKQDGKLRHSRDAINKKLRTKAVAATKVHKNIYFNV